MWAAPDGTKLYARVRPRATGRGVGSALLRELEARAAPRTGVSLTSWPRDECAAPLLRQSGYRPTRYFLSMRVELEGAAVESSPLVRPYAEGDDVYAAYRDSFLDHWGEVDGEEEWWAENRDAPNAGYDPALWFVTEAGGEIAGFAVCRVQDGAGWVSLVGVRPAHRGRGLGESLLRHSLAAFRDRGLARAALNVDAENDSGALRLYTKVGMEPVPAFTVWSK